MPRLLGRSTPLPAPVPATGRPTPLHPGTRRPLRGSFPSAASAERRTIGLVLGVLVTIWLVAVFGRALAQANSLNERQAREEATNASLRAQVAAGRAEIAFIQTGPFLQFESRSYGMGGAREHAFALESGAPAPAALVPLGSTAEEVRGSTPADDWLELLFGD
jgi:hypothetical protein